MCKFLLKVQKIDIRIKDIQHMLNITDALSVKGNITENCLLVSFMICFIICSPALIAKLGSNQ